MNDGVTQQAGPFSGVSWTASEVRLFWEDQDCVQRSAHAYPTQAPVSLKNQGSRAVAQIDQKRWAVSLISDTDFPGKSTASSRKYGQNFKSMIETSEPKVGHLPTTDMVHSVAMRSGTIRVENNNRYTRRRTLKSPMRSQWYLLLLSSFHLHPPTHPSPSPPNPPSSLTHYTTYYSSYLSPGIISLVFSNLSFKYS